MADELKARLSADTSGFKAGMADAATATEDGSQRMAAAMARAKIETSQLGEAYRVFGSMAASGNEQAVTALAEHIAAVTAAKQAVNELTQAEREAARVKAIGQMRQYQEYIASARQAETATKGVTQSMYAAQGASELLRGRLPIRAFERLTAIIPGVSKALQFAFPVIGLIALGEMAWEAGKALYNAFDMGGERARQAQDEIRGVNDELTRSTTELEVQTDKLAQEQAKLEKKPFNGTKLVLDEASLAAENLADKLDGVIKRELELMKLMAPSGAQTALAGFTGNQQEEVMLREHSKWLDESKNVQDELNESTSYGNQLHARLNDLLEKQAKVAAVRSLPEGIGGAAEVFGLKDYSKEIDSVRTLIALQEKEHTQIQATLDLTAQQAATQKTRDDHAGAGRTGNAGADLMRQTELDYDAQRQGGGLESLKAQHDFWEQYLSQFAKFPEQYKEIQDRITRIDEEGAKAAHSAIEKFKKDQSALADLKLPKMTAIKSEGEEELSKEEARGTVQAAELTAELSKQATAAALADDAITPLAAAQRNAADDTTLLKAKVKALNDEIERFKQNAKSWNQALGRFTDNKEQAQFVGLQNQKAQMQGQGTLQAGKNQDAIAQQMAAPYIKAALDIENAFFNAFNQVLLRQKSWSQAMAQATVSLEMKAVQSIEQWVEKWTAGEIMKLAKHVATNAAMRAADAAQTAQQAAAISAQTTAFTGAQTMMTAAATAAQATQTTTLTTADAAQKVIVTTTNIAEVLSYAAVAAAAAAAAAAPGGPPAMAAAATAAYAEVASFSSLAAFDVGTNFVPKTGIAMIHEGERIIPAADNRQLMGALAGGGGSRSTNVRVGSINNHYNNPGKPPSARQQAAAVRDMVRRGRV